MEAYLQAFVNFKQNNWARLLPIAEFASDNTKKASTDHKPFELNYNYSIILAFLSKKTPILAPGQKQLMSYWQSYKSW